QGPYLLERERLEKLDRDMVELAPLVREVGRAPSSTALVRYVADAMSDPETPPKSNPDTITDLRFMQDALSALRCRLDAPGAPPPKVFPSLMRRSRKDKGIGVSDDGFLISRSGQRLLMLLSPAQPLDTADK